MSLVGRRILVVEDEPLLAIDFADELEGRGALLQLAFTLEEASDAVSSQMPELAVLDVNLGSDLVWSVAKTLSDRQVPFLVVTGSAKSNLPPQIHPTGWFEKPVGAYAIADRLEEVVRRQFA